MPSVSGHLRRTNTFSAPRSDIRATLPTLSERAAAECRKCCANGGSRQENVAEHYPRHQQKVQGPSARWRKLHNGGKVSGLVLHKLIVAFAVWCCVVTANASAAEIYIGLPSKTIYIDGELQAGDALKFNNVVGNLFSELHEKFPGEQFSIMVRPYSPGGSVREAMEIGHTIRKNSMWVATNAKGQTCASACVLILAAGILKIPAEGSLGIHRPTFQTDLFATLTQEDAINSYQTMSGTVKSYLTEMGCPPFLFEDMMQVESSNIKWLTWSELVSYSLAGETPAYAEYQQAKRVELRKRLVIRYGETTIAQHEKADSSRTRFGIACSESRGANHAKACFEEAERRFPDPLK